MPGLGGARLFDSALFDRLCHEAGASPRRRKNANLHQSHAEAVQRFFNAIACDSYVRPHRHLTPALTETLIVMRGALGLTLFDAIGTPTARHVLAPASELSGVEIEPGVWHSVIALEDDTVIFEVKQGPFVPTAPEDFAPWAPAEGDPAVAAWMERARDTFLKQAS